jgi:predicted lipoprotein with Yx(FWY)xxD motif
MAAVAALAMGAAACGDDDSDDDVGDGGSQTTATTAAEPSTTGATGPATVATAETDLGEVLVDGEGMTLYLFTNDQGTTTGASEGIQQAWPPLTVESEDDLVAGEGVDEALLETAEQADGRIWVTYNDHLLYRYAADTGPGDTAGHGIGGVWFALTPAGEQVS